MNAPIPLRLVGSVALLGFGACSTPAAPYGSADSPYRSTSAAYQSFSPGRWPEGFALIQGFLGVNFLQELKREGGTAPPVDGDDVDFLPVVGGGGQWKLLGENVDMGLEGLIDFQWRANGSAFVAGGGGAVVAVDVDVFVVDLYGGPFISKFLGDRLRLYAAGGPMVSFGSYDQSGNSMDANSSGFGVGVYARAGLELAVDKGALVGVAAQWSDSKIDLSNGLGDLKVQGVQALITFSKYF